MSSNHQAKLVTQEDVARRAGVSRSIVSYVINNGPRKVSDETRNRVLEAIKALGYRPNKHAQMLSSLDDIAAERYIGIILAGNYMFKRPHYGSLLASMHEYAHQKDWHIRFIRVFEDFNNPVLFNELIHPNEINGVILIGLDQVLNTSDDRLIVEEIVRRVDRVVCVEWEWPNVPSIQFDRQNAAYQATHHLGTAGRNHIAYIGPEDKRVAGYRQALWEVGITPDERLVEYAIDARSGYDCCEQLLRRQIPIDAICTGTDEVAIGVLNCLHQYGLRVPESVAVSSIDNLDISAFTIPSLTTVEVPKQEIGFHTIDILVSDKSPKPSSAFAITVPTRLIVRQSTIVGMKSAS
jgi:DNA-binding LacI/PurR family transcriptional regulator